MPTRILIVDDDALVRSALTRSLRGYTDFEVEAVSSSLEAFERLSSGEYAVVISDYKMPKIDGVELLTWVAESYPHIRRILLTGHAELKATIAAVNEASVYRIIQKPWNDADLRLVIAQAVYEAAANTGSLRARG